MEHWKESVKAPELPAALLAPQTCPPGRCRFPGVPLPPPSPIILAALTKAYFAQMRRQLAGGCYALIADKKWESSIIEARLLELARAGFSPDEIIAQIGSKEERIRTEKAIRRTWSNHRDMFIEASQVYQYIAHESLAGSAEFIRMNLARMMNGREYTIVVNGAEEPLCLHDVLDPQNIEEWTAFLDVHQIFPLSDFLPEFGTRDQESFLQRVNDVVLRGKATGTGWESAVMWRRKMKIANDAFYHVLAGEAQEFMFADRFSGKARQALEQLGSALPLLAQLLFRPPTKDTRQFLIDSPIIHQFSVFVPKMFVPTLPYSRFALFGRPGIDDFFPPHLYPPSVLDTSRPPPSPLAPDKSFRNTKMVKNDSEIFWFILKRVEPRCCAPDRCSGRTPATINDPSAPDYARVESAITSILLGCYSAEMLATGINDKSLCETVLKATSTLECGTPGQRFDLLPLFERISQSFVACETSQREAAYSFVPNALRMLHDKVKSAYRRATGENRFPCLCDLVNNVDVVEALDEEIKRSNERIRASLPARRRMDMVVIQRWIAKKIRAGELQGSCWDEGRWTEKIVPFLEFFEESIEVLCVGAESRMAIYERFRQLFRVIGSARILEEAIEASATRQGDDVATRHLDTIVGMTYEEDVADLERDNYFKIMADKAMIDGGGYYATISLQKLSILAKPVGSWSARLNPAAQRLKFAISGSQFHQYSMAIQDCTMALYYCPPKFKFKAYYRRGIALARLQLWKKAILDLEQALLIEPQNPLIKQELAAARKKL